MLSTFLNGVAHGLTCDQCGTGGTMRHNKNRVSLILSRLDSVVPSGGNIRRRVSQGTLTRTLGRFLTKRAPLGENIFVYEC